jgi:CheY-like chemotaxis protein
MLISAPLHGLTFAPCYHTRQDWGMHYISDYHMGEMDGIEFLTVIASLYPEIVRIMLSSQAEKVQ